MTVSDGKLILGLITFMAYYCDGSSNPSASNLWHVLNYCALAGIDYYEKVFLLRLPRQVMDSATGDTSGEAATSFWKMNSFIFFLPLLPLKRAPPVCLSQTHLHWEGSERRSPLCHRFQTVEQQFCKRSNYFKSRKWKECSKVLASLDHLNASEVFVMLLNCPGSSSLHLFFPYFHLKKTSINLLTM